MNSTATTFAARDHARSQERRAEQDGPVLPADIDPALVTWSDRLPADGYGSVVLGRGTRIRLRDSEGAACAHLFLLRAEAPWERLSVADTLKVPWQAYLGLGHPLLSDQGRVLATVVTDTSGHHDALCGPSETARGLLLRAAAKQGLTNRDLGATVSLFRGVRVGPGGELRTTGGAGADRHVDLIVHLPVTLLLANAAHPLDDTAPTPLDAVAWAAPLPDAAVNPDPEYRRALDNTETAWRAATLEN
jgi:uncharacterized protein YcgI (DUF1989 family)